MGYWVELHRRRASRRRCARTSRDAGTLLFSPLVVAASLLVPALALGGLRVDAPLALRRRSSSRSCSPALLVMAAGFPEGTPLRSGAELHLQPRRRPRSSCARPTRRGRSWRSGSPGWAARRGGAVAVGDGARPARRARPRVALAGAGAGPARGGGVAAASRGARSTSSSLWKRVPSAWRDAGARSRPRPAARDARAGAARTAVRLLPTGAARSTRSCPRSPSGRWRCATSCRTPTCTPSTCCGRRRR